MGLFGPDPELAILRAENDALRGELVSVKRRLDTVSENLVRFARVLGYDFRHRPEEVIPEQVIPRQVIPEAWLIEKVKKG